MKLIALALALVASPAMAQQGCIGTPDAYASLTNNYGEERRQVLIMPDGRIVETWANEETGTWSLFITLPQGLSCPLASGNGIQTFEAKPNI